MKRKKPKPVSEEMAICNMLFELLPAGDAATTFASLAQQYESKTGIALLVMLRNTQQPTLSHLLASKPSMFVMGPTGVMRASEAPVASKKLKSAMSGDDIASILVKHMVDDQYMPVSSLCNKFTNETALNVSELLHDLGLTVNQFLAARREFAFSGDRTQVKFVSEQDEKPAFFQVFGQDAQPSISLRTLGATTTADTLRDLFLWLLGDQAVYAPSQFFVAHQPLIQQICCLVVSGMNSTLYDTYGGGVMETIFGSEARGAMVTPGTNNSAYAVSAGLLQKPGKSKSSKGSSVSAESLLLSESQLVADEYPPFVTPDAPGSQFPTFVETVQGDASQVAMYALDCEMCSTQFGLELARLTLVDADEAIKIDVLVKTTHPIVDYNTRYSGITEQMMESATLTLPEVRAQVMDLLHAQSIIVGHSVGNDLKVLRLVHKRVLDTACLYPHKSGSNYKNSLKWLSKRFLNQAIQGGSHDSAEDAIAALRLAKLKLQYGPMFGSTQKVSIWTVCKWNNPGALCVGADNARSLDHVINGGVGAAHVKLSSEGDAGVARDVVCSNVAGGSLVFGHLSQVYAAARADAGITEAIASAATNVQAVYEGLQKRTLFMVCGDRAVMDELLQLQQKPGVQQAELQELVKRLRKAYFWVTIKK